MAFDFRIIGWFDNGVHLVFVEFVWVIIFWANKL